MDVSEVRTNPELSPNSSLVRVGLSPVGRDPSSNPELVATRSYRTRTSPTSQWSLTPGGRGLTTSLLAHPSMSERITQGGKQQRQAEADQRIAESEEHKRGVLHPSIGALP